MCGIASETPLSLNFTRKGFRSRRSAGGSVSPAMPRWRDLAADMLRRDAILKALESGATCKLIGLELNVSGARVHQLAARARARQLMLRRLAMLEAAKGAETGGAAESPGLIDVAATR